MKKIFQNIFKKSLIGLILILVSMFFSCFASTALAQTSPMTYVFTVEVKKDGSASAYDLSLIKTPFSDANENEGDYHADLIDPAGQVLNSVKFDVNFFVLTTPPASCFDKLTGELTCDVTPPESDTAGITIYFPYIASADQIKVYKGSSLLFTHKIGAQTTSSLVGAQPQITTSLAGQPSGFFAKIKNFFVAIWNFIVRIFKFVFRIKS